MERRGKLSTKLRGRTKPPSLLPEGYCSVEVVWTSLPRPTHHGSSPSWENRPLYESLDCKSVVAYLGPGMSLPHLLRTQVKIPTKCVGGFLRASLVGSKKCWFLPPPLERIFVVSLLPFILITKRVPRLPWAFLESTRSVFGRNPQSVQEVPTTCFREPPRRVPTDARNIFVASSQGIYSVFPTDEL